MNFKTIAVALFGVALTFGAGSAAVALTTGQDPSASVQPTIVTEFVDVTGEPLPIDQVVADGDGTDQASLEAEPAYVDDADEYEEYEEYGEYDDHAEYEEDDEYDDHAEYEEDDEYEGADDDDA